jgi:arabinogalactan endo-1,4-beta-galactosidase
LVGTTMGFALYHQNTCGIVYKENGIPKNPFQSVKDHGGTIIRIRQDLPPYSNSYVENEPPVDYRTPLKVKESLQAADDVGLKTILTFSYQSFALESSESLNPYVAPLAWQPIASDVDQLADSVYHYTYTTLAELVGAGLIPEIVSVGNETNWRFMEPNLQESSLPPYSAQRVVTLLNAGTSAVRAINEEYNLQIRIALHIFAASNLEWWMNNHVPLGLDFDIMGLSHYHAWHSMGDFSSWTEVVEWVDTHHQKDFLMLETAQLFSNGYSDNHNNILGTDNIPPGYPNPPNTDTQKDYLVDLTKEILEAGGLGTIVWGGEWVGSDCYVYPDQYGPGSSWENKAFWDFDNNVHDGINWMAEACSQNSVNEPETESIIKIYPIPAFSNSITIESSHIRIKRVILFTILGKKIDSIEVNSPFQTSLSLNLTEYELEPGNYIFQVIDDSDQSYFYQIPVTNNLP